MRRAVLFAVLVGLPTLAVLAEERAEPVVGIRATVDRFAEALREEDYDAIAAMTYPRLTQKMGGPDGLIRVMRMIDRQRKEQAIHYGSATIQSISSLFRAGPQLHAVVEVEHVEVSARGSRPRTVHYLVVSEDEGSSWTLMNAGHINDRNTAELFPAFNRALPTPFKLREEARLLREEEEAKREAEEAELER